MEGKKTKMWMRYSEGDDVGDKKTRGVTGK